MTKFLSLLILIFSIISCTTHRSVTGLYKDNFPAYGMFVKTLRLSCNGNAEVIFRGDLMLDTSFAKWRTEGKYIILSFNNGEKNQRYKGVDTLESKGDKLIRHHISRDQYNKFKKVADSLNIKDFPKYKYFGRGVKDFKGHMSKQYYKLVKRDSCK